MIHFKDITPPIPSWFATFGGAIVAWYLSLPAAMILLMAMCILDYATGVMKAWVKGDLCSEAGLAGVVKKLMIFALVYGAHLVGTHVTGEYGFQVPLGSVFATIYSINELISIAENCHEVGIPIPGKLLRRLKKLTEKWTGDEKRVAQTGFDGPERRKP